MKHVLLVAAFLLSVHPHLSGQDAGSGQNIVAQLEWEPETVGSSAPRRIRLGDKPPEGVRLPAGIGKPHYGTVSLAGGKVAVALDANPGNPRLWVDRDFDGDLSDEKTTRLTRSGSRFSRTQYVLAPYDGGPPQPLQVQWNCSLSSAKPTLSLRVLVHRRGTVVLGGRLRIVAVSDGNSDGRFDDAKKDHIYLDSNGDGNLQTGSSNTERLQPAQPFRVGDEGWTAQVTDASGRAVEFVRSKTVPAAKPRTWPARGFRIRTPGAEQKPPKESLKTLLARAGDEKSSPYAKRYATINLIGRVGSTQAFDALVAMASDEKDRASRSAMYAALGNPAYLAERGDQLAALAREAESATGYSLTQALYSAGHPQRDSIYIQMLSDDAAVASSAARWLAYGGSEEAKQAISKAVRSGKADGSRYSAYTQGARNLPDGPPVELALHAAKDDYAMLKAEAVRDLSVLGHPDAIRLALAAATERPVNRTIGEALCEVLGQAGSPEAVRALLEFLDDDKLPASVRKGIVEQLRFVRAPKSITVVVKSLRAKQHAIRAVAAETLAALPERAITTALLKRTKKEKHDEVLPVLLEALGDHGDVMSLSTLLKRTRSRKPAVRTAAVRGLARLGFEHKKVRAFFLSMLQTGSWDDRVLALDAARETKDPTLIPKIVKSLDHKQWQVRLAAIEALQSMRSRNGVLPLIERLEDEEVQRVRDLIARVLFELTGVNGYDNIKTWRLWWSENAKTFTVPDEVPQLPNRSAGGTAAGFYGIPIVSERVVFLIDQSGSMSAVGQAADSYREEPMNRLDVAVRETLGALKKLDDRAKVNVIMFHSTIHPWKDDLQKLGSSRKQLERELKSKRPTGGTNIYDGLELALRMEDVDTIFLLSDGSPGQGKFVEPQEILQAIRRENQTRRIAIHCVSIGMDSRLLRQLAAQNGGRYAQR